MKKVELKPIHKRVHALLTDDPAFFGLNANDIPELERIPEFLEKMAIRELETLMSLAEWSDRYVKAAQEAQKVTNSAKNHKPANRPEPKPENLNARVHGAFDPDTKTSVAWCLETHEQAPDFISHYKGLGMEIRTMTQDEMLLIIKTEPPPSLN